MTHTKGPWEVGNYNVNASDRIVYSVNVTYAASPNDSISAKELRANAHLIASAPDMLFALEVSLEKIQAFAIGEDGLPIQPLWLDYVEKTITEAINKARGVI